MIIRGRKIAGHLVILSGFSIILLVLLLAYLIYRWPATYTFTIDNLYAQLPYGEQKDTPAEGPAGPVTITFKHYRYLFSPSIYEGTMTLDGNSYSFDNRPTGQKFYSLQSFMNSMQDKKLEKNNRFIRCRAAENQDGRPVLVDIKFTKDFQKVFFWMDTGEKKIDEEHHVLSMYYYLGPASTPDEAISLNKFFAGIEE